MKAGTIEGNGAGGVWVGDYGSFIMEGGTISDNKTSLIGGGGVSVHKNGIFTMKDGLIEKNTKSGDGDGGGVYVGLLGTLNMNGFARILSNKAEAGGGVYLQDGTFRQSGGEIYLNTAEKGDCVYVANGFPEYPSIFILTDDPRIEGVVYLEKGETIRPEGASFVRDWVPTTIEPQFYELPNDEPVQVLDKNAGCFSRFFHIRCRKAGDWWFVNDEGVVERERRSPFHVF